MALVLSKSAFAARRGVGSSAVANWIARDRLTGAALTADGRINVEEAERQLGVTLDASRSDGALALVAERHQPADEAKPLSLREQVLETELAARRRKLKADAGPLCAGRSDARRRRPRPGAVPGGGRQLESTT